MMRTRLLWFTIGASMTGAAMTQFVFKDFWVQRQSLSSQLKEKFDALDARVSHLESVRASPAPHQSKRLLRSCSMGVGVSRFGSGSRGSEGGNSRFFSISEGNTDNYMISNSNSCQNQMDKPRFGI